MSEVKYKFKTEEDLGFYILNAVCHDWIHDFNNYNRMRKIVNEIMQLVPDKSIPKPNIQQAVSTAMEQEKTVPEPETFEIQIAAEDRNLDDTTLIQASVASSDEKMMVEDVEEPSVDEPSVDELYESQEEYYLNEEVPTVPDIVAEGPHQAIVNESIEFYKSIKSTTNRYKMTRGNVRKINILQKLESFIGESQLLVISKISDSAGAGGGKMHGGSGINIITESHIVSAIDMIIKEINKTDANDVIITKIEKDIIKTDGKTINAHLINIFTLMREVFILLEITRVSPMEKFNSSLIKEITGMFILNKCNTLDIKKEAELYSKLYLPSKQDTKKPVLQPPPDTISSKFPNIFPNMLSKVLGNTSFLGGSNFSAKKYTENANSFSTLETEISSIRDSILNNIYTGTNKASSENKDAFLSAYDNFVKVDKKTLELIIGPQMYNARTKEIKNLRTTLGNSSGRNYEKNLNKLVDTITDFVFDKIIQPYEDVKNQVNAHLKKSESSPASKTPLPSVAKASVQKISQLLAMKILELTGYKNADTKNADLNNQIAIIKSVAIGVDYEKVDEKLITYFNKKYANTTYIQKGLSANGNLITAMNNAALKPRVINNAIPNGDVKNPNGNVKNNIVGKVVCPTSSVCDGMGAFGSCQSPTAVQKEYYNMNYSISAENGSNYYYGTTTLKENKRAVNITYGYNFNGLNLYNSFDIDISSPPIQLQANYSFAGVINRIVQIWKSSTNTKSIDDLWKLLENDAFFMSILKAGSPKSIGDIFQEVNSTLANGGYSNPNTGVSVKTTFGLMGDRPSGVRVLKLLDDAESGKNDNAYGGYIGDTTSLIYLPPPLPLPSKDNQRKSSTYKKKGGKKTIKKHKKTASKLTKKH